MTAQVTYQAYVCQGRVCVIGVAMTESGPVPLASYADIEGYDPNAPAMQQRIDAPEGLISGEDAPDGVIRALDRALGDVLVTLDREKMKQGAEDLVLRSRENDQNALAMIAMIGENSRTAKDASVKARAQYSAKLIREFIEAHPADRVEIAGDHAAPHGRVLAAMARECKRNPESSYPLVVSTYLPYCDKDMACVVFLANGPKLTREVIMRIASYSKSYPSAILYGCEHAHDDTKVQSAMRGSPNAADFLSAGRCIGLAMAIQQFREDEDFPLARVSTDVAWELGA